MNASGTVKISKFLSLVLRHEPQRIGITLDSAGWVTVDDLLKGMAARAFPISLDELREVVATNEKKRFAFSEDGQRIRASQGHSVDVELGYEPVAPPAVLYHGTVERFLKPIYASGLAKGSRHHVHLSADIKTATNVGQRRGEAIVLRIDAARMHADGHVFYRSANGVWLVNHVPPMYLSVEGQSKDQEGSCSG